MIGKGKKDQQKQRQVQRFYTLLQSLMNELFEYAPKDGHVKMPFNVSFGLIYDRGDSIMLRWTDEKSGKKVYLYNLRIIAKSFEERRNEMIADKTPDSLFNWISEVCSLYINPFVYEHVVNVQHRGKGAVDRTTRQIVRGFINKLLNDPDLKHVLEPIRGDGGQSGSVSTDKPVEHN
jgi:hypothetical protein